MSKSSSRGQQYFFFFLLTNSKTAAAPVRVYFGLKSLRKKFQKQTADVVEHLHTPNISFLFPETFSAGQANKAVQPNACLFVTSSSSVELKQKSAGAAGRVGIAPVWAGGKYVNKAWPWIHHAGVNRLPTQLEVQTCGREIATWKSVSLFKKNKTRKHIAIHTRVRRPQWSF